MFALGGNTFPQSRTEFENTLNEGLRLLGSCPGIVEIEGAQYPDLERLALDLSGARISNSIRESRGIGNSTPGARIQTFSIRANPLHLPEAEATLSVEARNVALDFDRNASGAPVLDLRYAEHGTLSLTLAKSSLESLIAGLARKAAAKKDIAIEHSEIALESEGPRTLRFRAKITAQKMIFTVEIEVTGRMSIDESLNACLSGLDCRGEGIVGAGACELLRPHLAKAEGRTISLAALPLGNTKLHDVQLHVGDPLRVEAVFGGA